MKKKYDVKLVPEQEPPTLEEKMNHYFESGALLRMAFGKPDASAIIQGIRGIICAVILWILIIAGLRVIILATELFI